MGARGRSRLRALGSALPWIAFCAYGIAVQATLGEDAWRPQWDSGIYVLTARSLASGEGYRYLGEPFHLRPPGFPFLLALTMPDGRFDARLVNGLMIAFATASLAAVYAAFRSRGRLLAATVALLTGTHPLFVRLLNWVYSEFPYMALLFLAVFLFERSGRRDRRWWAWSLGGALALAAAVHVRTVGLVLLPGLLLVGARTDRGRQRLRAALPVGVALLLCAPWLIRSGSGPSPGLSDQLLLASYATAMFHEQPQDPDSPRVSLPSLAERVASNGRSLSRDVGETTLATRSPLAAGSLLGAVVLGLLIAAVRRRSLLEWAAGAYLAVLLTYFSYDDRLMAPFVPFVYSSLLALLLALVARVVRRSDPIAGHVAVGLVLMTGLAVNLPRMRAGAAPRPIDRRRAQNVSLLAEWARRNTAPEARLLHKYAPSLSVLSERRVYTDRWAGGQDLVRKYDVDYVLLDGGPRSGGLAAVTRRAPLEHWTLATRPAPTQVYRMSGEP